MGYNPWKPTKSFRKLFHHKHSQLGLLEAEKGQEDRRLLDFYVLLAGSRLVKPLSGKTVLTFVQKQDCLGGWEAEPRELRAREKHSRVLKPIQEPLCFPMDFRTTLG